MNSRHKPESEILDEEEQWFEDHAEEFVPASAETRTALMKAARKAPKIIETEKKQMVSIRLAPSVVMAIKSRSARLGIPYQSLISSLLHQYALGDLVNIEDARRVIGRK